MPNLNMPGEGGARPPVQPMMPKKDMGGIVRILVIVLVVLGLGGGGFYLYKSGKLPFLSKKTVPPPPATEVVPPQPEAMAPAPQPTVKPPEPTKTPATPVKQEMGKGSFTLIVGAYHSKKTADDEAARWTNAGYAAMVSEKRSGASTWYRVGLGRYETKKTAMKAGKEMEQMFEMGYWVDKVE